MPTKLHAGASAVALAAGLAAAPCARAADLADPVVVVASPSRAGLDQSPQTTASVTADQAAATTDVTTVEDLLKDLPDVLIRERHFGDTQAPITTRTSGVGASARSLVYEDGVLVSALIGNNNTNASPRWDLISPDVVSRVDVMYGPFAAAFPGNSIGEVVQITTRTPDKLEGSLTAEGAWQDFSQYGTRDTYPSGRISGTVGDRFGPFAFLLSAFHLDTESQPLLYVTATTPAKPSAAGAAAGGGYLGVARTGAPIDILGDGGQEHQTEDSFDAKLVYDIGKDLSAVYTLGFFRNHDRAGVASYVSNAAGQPLYAGTLNLNGYAYSVANSAFDNDLYHYEEDHLAQSLTLERRTGGAFDWRIVASDYAYLEDRQRTPSTALPGAFGGGAGTITSLDDSGWYTLDAQAWWRPQGASGPSQLSFGAHEDRFKLESPKYETANWLDGGAGTIASLAKGETKTDALWAQDLLSLPARLTLTLGGRYEHWNAYGGYNGGLTPAPYGTVQPALSKDGFSPKAVLAWTPTPAWRVSGSIGRAYRFPTVEELYQAVTTGPLVSIPNPNLKPEDALSEEVSLQRDLGDRAQAGQLRVSLFQEYVHDALLAQSAPLVAGSTTLYSYTQNVGLTRVRGVELAGEAKGLGVPGVELSGWITYADSDILADNGYARAVGRQLPQLPRLRATAVQTWRPAARLVLAVTERYSDRAYGTIDNSDPVADTFTGFSAFFVVDVHAQVLIAPHLTGQLGVDNLGDRQYFLYHPFPQRTVVASLTYRY